MTDSTERAIGSRMAALYDAAMQDVTRLAARAAMELAQREGDRAAEFRAGRAEVLRRQIDERLARLRGQTDAAISAASGPINGALLRAARELESLGLSTAQRSDAAGRAGLDLPLSFGLVDDDAVRAIARDTEAALARRAGVDLAAAAGQHGEAAVRLFTRLGDSVLSRRGGESGGEASVNAAIARALIAGDPTIADREIRRQAAAAGAGADAAAIGDSVRRLGNQLIEVGQATMSVRAYARVVTTTRLREATESAHRQRVVRSGLRLGQIFGSSSVNFCTSFVGHVVSLTGRAESIGGVTYEPIETLPRRGPPFHPLCSKNTVAYDPELVSPGRVEAAALAAGVVDRRRRTGAVLEPYRS